MTVDTWRKAAMAAYAVAGLALAPAAYTLATTAANTNAIAAQQTKIERADHKAAITADDTLSAYGAAGRIDNVDTRPYGPVDWSEVAPQVAPFVVNISVIQQPKGQGERNRVWLVPGVQTNLATNVLNRYRAWRHGWTTDDQAREWATLGAGFISGDGNTVLTAAHVVNGAESVRVKMPAGDWRAARVIGYDYAQDVAVLLIAGEPGQPMPIAPAMPRQGQAVATIGAPAGWGFSLSAGVVSRYGDDGGLLKPARFMQIDAPVTGGSSGGVVFNARGEAVGMVSYGNRFTQTVPIGRVLAVADALRRGRHYE